ncbi:MAG TPA: RDD family protein [Ideonella sp.]|jgi:hypothetical protein|nr:RDD family protein [Ideonella sp.]
MTIDPAPAAQRARRVLVLPWPGRQGRDAGRWVTPEELNVAPGLLGMPLARPARRLLAMGVDLGAIGLVSSFSNFWLLAAFCLALAERARARRRGASTARTVVAGLLVAWMAYAGVQEAIEAPREDRGTPSGLTDEEAEDAMDQVAGAAVAALLAPPPPAASAPALAASAGAAPDPAATIAALTARVSALQRQLRREHQAAEEAERAQHWRERLRRLGLDFGIGYGWALVYFTLLPTWWKGQTLGKRLFGLRVREITGKPTTPVLNFKRFGGYLAGMATGGLGFLQLLWDANRQGLQDKAAHTVVVDERAPCRPVAPAASPPEDIVSPS